MGFTSIGGILAATIWIYSAIKDVRNKVAERINAEFESPRIQSLIEQEAKKVTEGRVETYITKQVADAISPLEKLTVINELESSARLGSRKAYEQLLSIARGKDIHSEAALSRLFLIQRELKVYQSPPGFYETLVKKTEKGETPYDKLSTEEMYRDLEDPSLHDTLRHTVMAYIVAKPQGEVIKGAHRILTSSESLQASAAACGILRTLLGEKANFLDFAAWAKIAEESLKAGSQLGVIKSPITKGG